MVLYWYKPVGVTAWDRRNLFCLALPLDVWFLEELRDFCWIWRAWANGAERNWGRQAAILPPWKNQISMRLLWWDSAITKLSEAALGWDVVTNTAAVRAAPASWWWEPLMPLCTFPQSHSFTSFTTFTSPLPSTKLSPRHSRMAFLKFFFKGRCFLEKTFRPFLGAEMLAWEEPAKHC